MKRFIPIFMCFAFISGSALAFNNMQEVSYAFNTLLFLICGVLVMFMAAGFTMLEAGMVQKKSVGVILVKNIALYSIAGLMFYLIGYNVMYLGVDGGYIGTFSIWAADDVAALTGDADPSGYASASDWFFQMVFVATTASVVSGAVAERIKVWPFLIFTAVLAGVIYPIIGSWKWGGGWLDELGFADFAGSTLVHSTGGWAALTGAILLGARKGRFDDTNDKNFILSNSSLPLVALGTFILWLGWFGFNGGSQLAFGTVSDAIAVSTIFANTNAAAAAGVVTVLIISHRIFGHINLPLVLNGALAGLVSITAEPLTPTIGQAALIGAHGGLIMLLATLALEKAKIDDVVGAIPVHLAAGIWGTIAVVFTNPETTISSQLIGIAAIGAFVSVTTFIVWLIMRMTIGIRLSDVHEELGGDMAEIGMRAYDLHHDEKAAA